MGFKEMTLWDAAYVTKHNSFFGWYRGIKQRIFTQDQPSAIEPTTINNLQSKKGQIIRGKLSTPTSTFIVGIHPTKKQKLILDTIIRTSNYAYNWCNWLMKNGKRRTLHNIVYQSQHNIPPHLRQSNHASFFEQGIIAMKTAVCCHLEKFKYGNNLGNLAHKDISVRPYTGSFQVDRKYLVPVTQLKSSYNHLNSGTMLNDKHHYVCLLPDFFNKQTPGKPLILHLSKPMSRLPPFKDTLMVVKEVGGKYRLHIKCEATYTRKVYCNRENTAICGIDPGSRTFATVYDATRQKCFQVGFDKKNRMHGRTVKYNKTMVLFQQASAKGQEQETENRKRQLLKIKSKIHSAVTDIHVRFASMLVCDYALVSVGKIHVAYVKKGLLSILTSNKSDKLLWWNHDQFRKLLKHRSLGEKCTVIFQNERFTSKTCGQCGQKNKTLGSKEFFRCARCNYQTHRDVNGARNILRKTLGIFYKT